MNAIVRHAVHVCLVSEQATPNFIPILDRRFRPREVVLVVSSAMRERAAWLRAALSGRVDRVSECAIGDAWNVQCVQEALLDLVASREHDDLALNVTGGIKPTPSHRSTRYGTLPGIETPRDSHSPSRH